VYHESEAHPRDQALADIYIDLPFPSAPDLRPYLFVNMVQTFDGQAALRAAPRTPSELMSITIRSASCV